MNSNTTRWIWVLKFIVIVCVQSSAQGVPLTDILEKLETSHGLRFSFETKIVSDLTMTQPLRKWSKRKWLRYIKDQTGLEIVNLNNDHYVLRTPDSAGSEAEALSIRVLDEASRQPVPMAAVAVKHSTRGTVTDDKGLAGLADVSKGDTLVVQMLGYEMREISVSELASTGFTDVEIRPTELELDQVLIERAAVLPISFEDSDGSYRVRPQQLNLQNGWGEPDLLRTLQGLPGISSFDESAANLSIRGGTPDQNLITVDGIPIYKFGHFFGMITALNPYIMDDVKVYKGGFGAEYGARSSSVIDISNSADSITEFGGGLGMNLLSLHGHLEFPFLKNRGSFQFSTRSSVTSNLQTNTYQKIFSQLFQTGKIADYQSIEQQELLSKNIASFQYADLNTRLTYRFKKDDEFSFTLYNSNDEFTYDFEIDQPFLTHKTRDDFNSQNTGVNLSVSNRWFPTWQSKLSFIGSQYSTGIVAIYTGDLADPFHIRVSIRNSMDNQNFIFSNKINIGNNQNLDVGLQYNRYQIHLNTLFEQVWEDAVEALDVELTNEISTFYADYDLKVMNALSISAGFRLNRINEIAQNIWEPRLAMQFVPGGESPWIFKLQTGSYKQFVSTVILEEEDAGLNIGNDLWITTTLNDDIPVLATEDYVAGFAFNKNGFLLDVETYYKYTRGLSIFNLDHERPDDQQFSPGEAEARGLEILIQKKWNAYRSMFAYTLSRVDYMFPEINRGLRFAASQDQLHNLHWSHFYKWKKWDFIFGWHLGSGRPYTRPDGITTRTQESSGELFYRLDRSSRNQQRVGIYHRGDISVQLNVLRPRWQLKTGLTIYNFYDRRNQLDRQYFIVFPDGNEIPEIASIDHTSLRRTINFFIRAEF